MTDDLRYPARGGPRRGTQSTWSPAPPSRVPVVLACVFFAISSALAYASWMLWQGVERSETRLSAGQRELQQERNKVERLEGHIVVLEANEKIQAKHLTEAQTQARDLLAQLAAVEARLDEFEDERFSVDEKLKGFRSMTRQFQAMIDSGHLAVDFRRGRMIVELPAELLFPSGSADLTEKGSAALAQVARILRGVRNRRFVVVGHTDNLPVSNTRFANNWELSTERALHVTQALIAAGVRPKQLVAAGRSEYEPVASNRAAQGRQKNRRIEIVLEPRLKDVKEADEEKNRRKD